LRGSSEQRLGRVNVPAGAAPLRLSEASARRLLLELEKGMFPTFEYEDRADLKEQVEVALSAVNFRSGYNRFTACSRALGEKMTKAAPKAAAKPVNDAVALTPEPAAAVVETRPLQPDSGAHAPIMTGEPLPPGVGAPPAMPATLHKAGMPAAPRDTPGVETRAPAVDTALLGPDHLAVEGPAAAEPAPAHLADKPWEQGVVLFEPGSTELSRQARDHLDLLATLINQGVETGMVRINGHADAVGSPRDNAQLSHLRADTVRDYLVQQGVEPTRLLVEHFGEARPAAPNDDATRRAENRRVNLYLVR
jgi:outer membrane protein OmpA-like peptidoglycan-associated protein